MMGRVTTTLAASGPAEFLSSPFSLPASGPGVASDHPRFAAHLEEAGQTKDYGDQPKSLVPRPKGETDPGVDHNGGPELSRWCPVAAPLTPPQQTQPPIRLEFSLWTGAPK